jgi:hypothetical protein
LPFDPEREHATASFRAKQLVILAADVVLAMLAAADQEAAERLIAGRVLPACYRRRYDRDFLESLHNTVEQTRNALVSDIPFLGSTASELAGHAIFTAALQILAEPDPANDERAAAIDPEFPGQLSANGAHLADEIDSLFAATLVDADFLALFEVPADQEPDEHLHAAAGPDAWRLLRFDDWFKPFGGAPRPHVTYDGRAWPSEA